MGGVSQFIHLKAACLCQKKFKEKNEDVCTQLLRASCLTLEIEEFRCYEVKIEEYMCATEAFSTEDGEGWWLSGCGSVAEHFKQVVFWVRLQQLPAFSLSSVFAS